jgi:hypothetical protein
MTESSGWREVLDRQLIWDGLLRYTRGADRLDRDLFVSAFHPDAVIDTGTFKGNPKEYADFVLSVHREQQAATYHSMSNFWCEIAGDTAYTETYVTYYAVNRQGETDMFNLGRYIDQFEKRDGNWAIVARVVPTDASIDLAKSDRPPKEVGSESMAQSTRDKADPSYRRPLHVPGR